MDLTKFESDNLYNAGKNFFEQLNVPLKTKTKQSIPADAILNDQFKDLPIFNSIKDTFYLGLIDNSIFLDTSSMFKSEGLSLDESLNKVDERYDGIMVFAVKLDNYYPNRTDIANLVRAFNKSSKKVPVIVLLSYQRNDNCYLTFSTTERIKYIQNWREGEKLGKVSMLKDINIRHPHTGHLKILQDLKFEQDERTFEALYKQWKEVFDIQLLNKRFYQEIANWYFWAMTQVEFPQDAGNEKDLSNATSLIRLLTRLIFVWFLKEKHLVPEKLFDKKFLDDVLDYKDKTGSTYYKAILQNLFFATLNTIMKKDDSNSRIFIDDAKNNGFINDGYLQSGYYRYKRFIKDHNLLLQEFASIPFLNGGLFECLDEKIDGKEVRIDCFSDNPKNEEKLKVPDELFFASETKVDLNNIYDTKNKEYETRGLINILNSYKFTVAENTPIEEEIALDPELLGRVFENLLAVYNPETGTTARKATGSYYTPREIVNYMVDESLISYLENKLQLYDGQSQMIELPVEQKLRQLISYTDEPHRFDSQEVETLINAIDNLKILDPACGSGAFPMGILHKLVYILHKLDPDNSIWKQKLIDRTPPEIREETRKALENKPLDYIRKLGLIESCIYGVDIQPIAIQIAKLRFFISLIVEQKIDDTKENRDIKALPNLETKFVAANTLIGLKKDNGFKTPAVENAENELFRIRKDIFYTNSSQKKKKLQKKEKSARQALKNALLEGNFGNKTAEQIASWDPFDQNASANWFDPEWMFGITEGFDIVNGNPPYISTKGVDTENKKQLEKNFGFADDAYNHFFFKAMQLLKENGILTFITSKTYWTIQTKKNLRELLLKNTILQIFDTANPFENAMVDTGVIIVKKISPQPEHEVVFLDGKTSITQPQKYIIQQNDYVNAPNKVIFMPTDFNKKIYQLLGKKVNELLNQWWDKIDTSKNIEKNKKELERYRNSLKPGDITLLGLITEGGVGIQTGNNGKYIGVLEGTKWADNVRKQRPEKLLLATRFCKEKNIKTKADAQTFLHNLSEKEIRQLFDDLKEQYGRDVFGQGWLYRIVSPDEIAEVDILTDDEKLNGIKGARTFVPYDKGDKDGNRWYAPTPYYIDWSRENVKFLKENSGKKGEGMPVVRNPQFYFREGFCWNNVLSDEKIKCRLKEKSVHSTEAMTFISLIPEIASDYYLICLLNSTFFGNYRMDFINVSHHLTTGDAKEFPIIIPTSEQLKVFEDIFNRAVSVQKQKFAGKISEKEAEVKLEEIQRELDERVMEMYGVK